MTTMPSSQTDMKNVIIFGGTGAIGMYLTEYLSESHPEWQIQIVSRNVSNSNDVPAFWFEGRPFPSNARVVQGDPYNAESVMTLSANCDILYCCIGLHRYERKYWSKYWPLVVKNLLAPVAADPTKKKLVFCDNLYAYGPGKDRSEKSTRVMPSLTKSKPSIRSWMHDVFKSHMKEYPGTLTVLGAADFFGPHITDKSILGSLVVDKIIPATGKGKSLPAPGTAMVIGSADMMHDFCYAPDFAKTMAVASINEAAYDHFWVAPHAVHNKTTRQIAQDILNLYRGQDVVSSGQSSSSARSEQKVKVTVLGPWMIYMTAPFMTIMREMIEMLPFWTADYTVDGNSFSNTFDVHPTSYKEALQALVEFYVAKKQPAAT